AVALRNGMHLPAMAMISLSMLPLFYPLVDAATWQRLAAAAKNDKNAQPQALRKILLMSAVEAPLLWLLVGMFGALAAAAAHLPAAPDAVTAFIRWLENEENAVSALALRLLSVALLAMTMPAMSAMFSACLCTIRYDLMPALPSLSADEERIMRRRTTACAIALHAAAVTTLLAIAAIVPTNFASIGFLAFLSALATLQLSLAPLLLGGLRAEKTMVAALHPHWALGIIAAGAGCGVLTIVLFFMTGSEPWLWDSIPACLAAGSLLTAVARFSQRSRAG
ncbi:MAG TPA: hypothetical protein VFA53_02470, partial [Xanthobacteraceae bacterium]|nr:hypothetical protein [Xanthobacteraceae bacterium]